MPFHEQGTYTLYERGFEPGQLALGHLVLGDFKNPLMRKYCAFPHLSETELHSAAYVRGWKGKTAVTKKGNQGLNLLVLGGGEIGPHFSIENKKIVSAEKGRRVELKSPSEFLQRVLANEVAKSTLRLWTSVTKSQYMTMRVGLAKTPKIWMLTGLLELEDGKSHTVKGTETSLNFGIDPEAVTMMCGAPVGASVEIGRGREVEVESQLFGTMVWAARFQLLKTKFKIWDGKTAMAQNEFQLHPDDIFAGNVVLGEDSEEQIVELTVDTADATETSAAETDDIYWDAFEEAERRLLEDLEGLEEEI